MTTYAAEVELPPRDLIPETWADRLSILQARSRRDVVAVHGPDLRRVLVERAAAMVQANFEANEAQRLRGELGDREARIAELTKHSKETT